MMIHGYCEKCKRVKRVRVNTPAMVSLVVQGVAVGVCDECAGK